MDELLAVLDCCHSTSLGPSAINNHMLTRLPPTDKVLWLSTYNCIWSENSAPAAMWVVTVVPLPISGDSHSLPTCYIFVMLTRCIYKTMEWMVNHWLIRILEDRNLLSNTLCYKSTPDHLMNMEHHIQNCSSCANTIMQSCSSWTREAQQSFLTFEAENRMPVFHCLCYIQSSKLMGCV
jgi:hypothetical protein